MFIPADSAAAPPLEDDIRVFDASRLTIHQAADNEVGRFAIVAGSIVAGIGPRMHAHGHLHSPWGIDGTERLTALTLASVVFQLSFSTRMPSNADSGTGCCRSRQMKHQEASLPFLTSRNELEVPKPVRLQHWRLHLQKWRMRRAI